ncbi:hypothetical protein FSP39_015408 [Pinctada imbricata]|uniref:NAD(P)(+)--arginine ADP-ribosyltransferase n=1 Tax=Pinctada imbricata TaxID=66713 RepID=A0AA88YIP5_PINIB|nr:hypothetical protein FSP39_015408 [Pinctada imbricata]
MATIRFLLELFALLALCGNTISALEDYGSRYESRKLMYEKRFTGASENFKRARSKSGANHFNHYSPTEKAAVEVVNLYTQESRGIDNGLPPGIPGTTVLRGFTSASIYVKPAVEFGIRNDCDQDGCQVLLILYEAEGLYVKKYSAIPSESEVIIKLNSEFHFPPDSVLYRSSNKTKLDDEIKRLNIDTSVNILARGKATAKRRRRDVSYCVSDGDIVAQSYVTVVSMLIISAYTGYHSKYEDWKNEYKGKFGRASDYLGIAQQKSNDNAFHHYSRTEKDAVEVINLYTQGPPQIYRTVNEQYRRGFVEKIWKDYAALLNEALDILRKYSNHGCKRYREVYRRTTVLPDGIPGTTVLKGFTSSSLYPNPGTMDFGVRRDCQKEGCQVLLVLNDAEGLYVKEYSRYPEEEEVIIKLNSKFSFPPQSFYDRNKQSQLDEELQRLKVTKPAKILAKGTAVTSRRRRSISTYCSVSDGNVFVPSYVTVVSIMIISNYAF